MQLDRMMPGHGKAPRKSTAPDCVLITYHDWLAYPLHLLQIALLTTIHTECVVSAAQTGSSTSLWWPRGLVEGGTQSNARSEWSAAQRGLTLHLQCGSLHVWSCKTLLSPNSSPGLSQALQASPEHVLQSYLWRTQPLQSLQACRCRTWHAGLLSIPFAKFSFALV